MRTTMLAVLVCLSITVSTQGGQSAAAKKTEAPRAATRQMLIPSHGSVLLGVFYLAAGAGSHPTAIVLHGFPGFEQNLDMAQTLRANGWNVLAMHYRGSWGVKGDFSFEHAAEDADTEVQFVLDAANAEKYRIDTHRIVVTGHSMGGYMAASAIAHNAQVSACVLISAWNIGADYETRHHTGSKPATIESEAAALEQDGNLVPLSGTSGLALAREIHEHEQQLNMLGLVRSISPRPVLVITANDGLADTDHAFAEALRKAGDAAVTEKRWNTDHSYSGEREQLTTAIVQWARSEISH